MKTPSKDEALASLALAVQDLEALESGDWQPDADSVWAVLNQLECVQAFLEALPCQDS